MSFIEMGINNRERKMIEHCYDLAPMFSSLSNNVLFFHRYVLLVSK